MDDYKRPFSMQFVCRATLENMHKSIDISQRKTMARVEDRPEKMVEIMETITVLNKMREVLSEFEENNTHLFKD